VKILIAEDDAISRRLLDTILRKWGYEVVTAYNGAQAWKELQKEDSPRLVILDWMMPAMNGLELCRKVRECHQTPYQYILLATARDAKQDLVRGLEAGADEYLTKPFKPAALNAAIERVLLLTPTERQHRMDYLVQTQADRE